ncbi:MAG: hypothetical protein JSV10_06200 [Candidatus Zixiibacteriota bacterium]|nr:MAG: hypothetical protein JSV10_06200 [candidate division Zixibacteria bacterium]
MLCSRCLKLSLILIFLFAGLSSLSANADEKTGSAAGSSGEKDDSLSSAPDTADLLRIALDDFHAVLRPLWHESYAEEDFKSIREKAPVLQQKILALIRIPAPAELSQDEGKLNTFLSKRQELAFNVMELNRAAKDGHDSTLASAFESMHWTYEELEKFFAVQIEALDQFHETLYFLWYRALPERKYGVIRETAPVIKAEVDSLMKVPVPSGYNIKKDEFEKKKVALKDAVYTFAQTCEKGTEDDIDAALKATHDRFAELDSLLR